jgi:hypothetical protein
MTDEEHAQNSSTRLDGSVGPSRPTLKRPWLVHAPNRASFFYSLVTVYLSGARDHRRICTYTHMPHQNPTSKPEKVRTGMALVGAQILSGLFLPKHMHLCQILPPNGLDDLPHEVSQDNCLHC